MLTPKETEAKASSLSPSHNNEHVNKIIKSHLLKSKHVLISSSPFTADAAASDSSGFDTVASNETKAEVVNRQNTWKTVVFQPLFVSSIVQRLPV